MTKVLDEALKAVTAMSRWTPEQEKLLGQLWPTDLTRGAIARRLGKTIAAIQHKASKLGLYKENHGNRLGWKKPKLTQVQVTEDTDDFLNSD